MISTINLVNGYVFPLVNTIGLSSVGSTTTAYANLTPSFSHSFASSPIKYCDLSLCLLWPSVVSLVFLGSAMRVSPNDSQIFDLFKYCQSVFTGIGIKLNFPKDTKPQNTYMWRYLRHFCDRINEHNIDKELSYKLVDSIINNAKRYNQLHKGLAILASDRLIELSINSIGEHAKTTENIVDKVKRNHVFLGQFDDKIAELLYKKNRDALPNIVMWYKSDRLCPLYLAISETCGNAIRKLPKDDRILLPSGKDMVITRYKWLADRALKYRLRAILGKDWKEI